jgi:hypothetical protein
MCRGSAGGDAKWFAELSTAVESLNALAIIPPYRLRLKASLPRRGGAEARLYAGLNPRNRIQKIPR